MTAMEIDSVADLLKHIKGTATTNVPKQQLEKAIMYHNKMRDKLQKYESKDRGNNQVTRIADNQGQQGEHRALERANKRLAEENDSLRKQLDELKLRFSKIAGDKMMDGNPNITDLSDQYRPTKLAEYFRTLYDEEWTQAFENLEKLHTGENEILGELANIIKKADEFCTSAANQQMANIEKFDDLIIAEIKHPKYEVSRERILGSDVVQTIGEKEQKSVRRQLRELRKSLSHLSTQPLGNIFVDLHIKSKYKKNSTCFTEIELFAKKLIKIVLMMKIQEPPVELFWQKQGEQYKKDMFSEYTRRGRRVVQTVWPAVILHKGGPLMTKGVVQVTD